MSAKAEPTQFQIEGLHGYSFGNKEYPALILSAGLGGSGAYWSPQIDTLAAEFRVIIYDHRGTGRSDRAPLPFGYEVGDLADDIAKIMDGLEIEAAHVVGHAAGGVAALELARTKPDRVNSLAIVNGWAIADHHFIRCFDLRLAALDAGGADAYLKLQPLFLYPASWISRHLTSLDAERVAHRDEFQGSHTLRARIAALQSFNILEDLPSIRAPTLIMVSQDDMLVPPSSSDALVSGIPQATAARFSYGGHAVNITEPERFNHSVLQFLKNIEV